MSTKRDTSGVLALLFPHVNTQNTEYCNVYSKINPNRTNKLTLHQRRDLASGEIYSRYQTDTDTRGLQQILSRAHNTRSQYTIKLFLGPQPLAPPYCDLFSFCKQITIFMSNVCCFCPF